jgi:predicted transcriptional regulator
MLQSTSDITHRPSPLRLRRLTLGLTQDAVAAGASLSRTHLARLERGEFDPKLGTARALSRALDCEPDDIFPGGVP